MRGGIEVLEGVGVKSVERVRREIATKASTIATKADGAEIIGTPGKTGPGVSSTSRKVHEIC